MAVHDLLKATLMVIRFLPAKAGYEYNGNNGQGQKEKVPVAGKIRLCLIG
ncbi:MAG: hypothetical protein KKF28_03615 [Proteobacteria bacterium]|nr:hypothetical protein [Pseudomonadota bacterium]MBU4074461.1 hypothetical protein [Pseudomonadota bacterium]